MKGLSAALSLFEQLPENGENAILILDHHGNIQRFNKICEEVTGLTESDVIGQNAFRLFMHRQASSGVWATIHGFRYQDGALNTEVRVQTAHRQHQILFRTTFIHHPDGQPESYLVCSGMEITDKRSITTTALQSTPVNCAPLLPQVVSRHIQHIMMQSASKQVALMVVEIAAPDDAMARIKSRINRLLLSGQQMILTHHGQMWLSCVPASARRLTVLAKRILNLDLPDNKSIVAVGMAIAPFHGRDSLRLIRNASAALDTARRSSNRHCLYSPDINAQVFDYLWLDNYLARALPSSELEIHYQPKINADGSVSDVEALLRWRSPGRGMISPAKFIHFAESTGQIIAIGRWVMEQALQQAARWRDNGIHLRVAVNLSPLQLCDGELFLAHKARLRQLNFSRSPLDIELTESCLAPDQHQARTMIRAFRHLGARIHLDDFGTGYSSLSQLVHFPINAVKLDKSFVRDVHRYPSTQSLVQAIVAMAHVLEMEIIAEGVETPEEDNFITACGIEQRQGFLFARPMPAEDLERWLEDNTRRGKSRPSPLPMMA
ncbi:EAL domain-containing protein [Shimwellia blattae]|uniref:cyclic-guanylate-specific phosphodiesterase n=1 Tax=Shimwellia blattae (strain ATCC 29907 / DSM 4481 / JCM 1650 / NBRC 105725 / CDC 9005-74) TaxID=630626 RepID=I2B877_SHIBC|nr:EAL domain-containing protein [Shimwellia blattae]AFJ46731.1 diguanylate cyclase/phosphodiesterase withPAS/PAC sensor(s) [Shimwellia blattae DSM 4481 = NBRC 105725]GAB82041.1 putative cyclic di-GMP phosphodiesterase [Shimwellia blattae DSM 4481 = NBRC 105725]VDY64206.1 Cyclic di-GMP phosphodiesterase Gmr [Shimwellia blattae]VEC22335.1 Cyclic di-GMP phosphodiesterase Gmr [Shimwellia blattae]